LILSGNFLAFSDYYRSGAELKVELVRYTHDPVVAAGKAGGVCYDKEEKEDYGKFIQGIVRRGHESVIEHVVFTFRIEGVSRACTHQLVRHRIASYSQRSQRYVDEGEFDYVVPPSVQGSEEAQKEFVETMDILIGKYEKLKGMGVAKEDARFVLPNACTTTIVVTINARSLRNLFRVRMEKHAQWEIRLLAQKMFDLVTEVAPPLFEDLQKLRDTGKEE
jgi:thymidylate synthase (FAD)